MSVAQSLELLRGKFGSPLFGLAYFRRCLAIVFFGFAITNEIYTAISEPLEEVQGGAA